MEKAKDQENIFDSEQLRNLTPGEMLKALRNLSLTTLPEIFINNFCDRKEEFSEQQWDEFIQKIMEEIESSNSFLNKLPKAALKDTINKTNNMYVIGELCGDVQNADEEIINLAWEKYKQNSEKTIASNAFLFNLTFNPRLPATILAEYPAQIKCNPCSGLHKFIASRVVEHPNVNGDIIDSIYERFNTDLGLFSYIVSSEKTKETTLGKIVNNPNIEGTQGIDVLCDILDHPNLKKDDFDILWSIKDKFKEDDYYPCLLNSFLKSPHVTEDKRDDVLDYLIDGGFFSPDYDARSIRFDIQNWQHMTKDVLERIREAGKLEPLNYEKMSLNMYTPEEFTDLFYHGYVLYILVLDYEILDQNDVERFINKCFFNDWWRNKYKEKVSQLKEEKGTQKKKD